jgi:hypothetical protein
MGVPGTGTAVVGRCGWKSCKVAQGLGIRT